MPQLVPRPVEVPVPGGKRIAEFVGAISTGDPSLSVAHMQAPPGWTEPAQTPQFQEVTLVLQGRLYVETPDEEFVVHAGQAIVAAPGETVRYSTRESPAEYVAVCLPGFSEDLAGRES